MMNSWLPLTDYSTKYKVSVSTLRRRIKTEDIKFRFQDGKYLILDEHPAGSQPRSNRPSLKSETAPGGAVGSARTPEIPVNTETLAVKKEEPILMAATKLLNELKSAYTKVLQEKEEQILHLKEEVSDLKTLVKVLESEHSRAMYRN